MKKSTKLVFRNWVTVTALIISAILIYNTVITLNTIQEMQDRHDNEIYELENYIFTHTDLNDYKDLYNPNGTIKSPN